jgi:LPS-assembly protein
VFDTGEPDFNFVQLFRDNRFNRHRSPRRRRISSRSASPAACSTASTAKEYLNATFGTDRLLRGSGRDAAGRDAGDAGPVRPPCGGRPARIEGWNADVGYQWDPDQTRADKSARAPSSTARQDAACSTSDIASGGPSWNRPTCPSHCRWARASMSWDAGIFSLPEGGDPGNPFPGLRVSELLLGHARRHGRRYVSTRSGDTESAIFLQLELKGLTSLGSPADDLLEHGILGYSR